MFCVVYCFLSRFARARFSLNKRRALLAGPQSRTCGRQFGVNFGRSPERLRSRGQGPVFPANERGTRHSHLPEESDKSDSSKSKSSGSLDSPTPPRSGDRPKLTPNCRPQVRACGPAKRARRLFRETRALAKRERKQYTTQNIEGSLIFLTHPPPSLPLPPPLAQRGWAQGVGSLHC